MLAACAMIVEIVGGGGLLLLKEWGRLLIVLTSILFAAGLVIRGLWPYPHVFSLDPGDVTILVILLGYALLLLTPPFKDECRPKK